MTGEFFGEAKPVWFPSIGGLRLCAPWLQSRRNQTIAMGVGGSPPVRGHSTLHTSGDL